MAFSWKKTAILTTDTVLGIYLVLAVTAFNRPDELSHVCDKVKINIEESSSKGFLNANDVKIQLQQARLYPLGDVMKDINPRKIEESLLKNPIIDKAQCYKTQTGHVIINLVQRLPVIRIKADNGEDYYVDEFGNIMPETSYANDLVVATGAINKKYAQKFLTQFGNYLIKHPLWRSQIEQLNILHDGSVEAIPRVGDHVVYLGKPVNIDKKFSRLEKFYRYGLSQAGWNKYSYISLEFDNQIICKKRKFTTM